MPYSRRSRYAKRRSGTRTSRSYRTTTSRRRYGVKKRTYRKKRAMSRKSILNVTSRKKRNTMLTLANTSTANGGTVTIGPGPLLVNGRDQGLILFMPTAMDLTDGSGAPGTVSEESSRTSTNCYMRGFREKIRIQTSTGIPWFWRRLVFTSKRPQLLNAFQPGDTPVQTNLGNPTFSDTSNGMQRLYFNQSVNIADNTIAAWNGLIFRGQRDKDWTDILTARVDPSRVDLRSDVCVTIKSGNQAGTVREFSRYYAMNKSIVYDDDENGDRETSSYTSVQDKRGMGDVYIYDIFVAGTGAGVTDLLQLQSSSTLYWHEK